MFPIDISGSIHLRGLSNPTHSVKPVTERIVDVLDEAGASEVWTEGDTVRFKRGFFAGGPGGRWNILVQFNSGTLRIETEDTALRVHYRLSTVQLLLVISGMMAVLFGIALYGSLKHGGDWHSAAKIAGIGWLWLFGMNYITGATRIPFWLKRELKNIAK